MPQICTIVFRVITDDVAAVEKDVAAIGVVLGQHGKVLPPQLAVSQRKAVAVPTSPGADTIKAFSERAIAAGDKARADAAQRAADRKAQVDAAKARRDAAKADAAKGRETETITAADVGTLEVKP